MKRVRVVASGRVQGVFYRVSCARLARGLGLTGYVRNLPDGRVEAAFEGSDSAVDEMVAWSRVGPDLANVDRLDVVVEDPLGETGFRVTG
ncbi:MAG TPA: acylphosphatase [Actinomycetota bacterium]|jgi:acylphosphatase|nr:acylphosphatase [Actinomycetota bacterium]